MNQKLPRDPIYNHNFLGYPTSAIGYPIEIWTLLKGHKNSSNQWSKTEVFRELPPLKSMLTLEFHASRLLRPRRGRLQINFGHFLNDQLIRYSNCPVTWDSPCVQPNFPISILFLLNGFHKFAISMGPNTSACRTISPLPFL